MRKEKHGYMLFVVSETDREIDISVTEREVNVNVLSFYISSVNLNSYTGDTWYQVVMISRPYKLGYIQ